MLVFLPICYHFRLIHTHKKKMFKIQKHASHSQPPIIKKTHFQTKQIAIIFIRNHKAD